MTFSEKFHAAIEFKREPVPVAQPGRPDCRAKLTGSGGWTWTHSPRPGVSSGNLKTAGRARTADSETSQLGNQILGLSHRRRWPAVGCWAAPHTDSDLQ